jgi:hypothetical protein
MKLEADMWEYTVIKDADLDYLMEKANKLGEQGWEGFGFASTKQAITSAGNHMIALKRELEDSRSMKH